MNKLLKNGRSLLWATLLAGVAFAPIARATNSLECFACGVCVVTTGPEDPLCWIACYECITG